MEEHETKQSRPLTGTDVRILAGGYWGRYFMWRVHPRSKWLSFVSVSTLALLLILIAVAGSMDTVPVSYYALLVLLGAVTIIGILAGFCILLVHREHYINKCVDNWERGDPTLPDEASVVRYIRKSKRVEEDDDVSV